MQFNCPFVLASGSPRRKQLLNQLGVTFKIHVSDVHESFVPGTSPNRVVEEIALRKVKAVSTSYPDALTLAADTIVVFEDVILGKPASEEEAIAMLEKLSGNGHTVYTGIAVAHEASGRLVSAFEKTTVYFAEMSREEIAAYVDSGSPMDKAGAYGIQDDRGALFVAGIEGDFYNVVGLPLHRLYQTIKQDFADLLLD